MAKRAQTLFLEEWLKRNSDDVSNNTGSKHSSSQPARAIIQAWADLRDSLQHQSFQRHHLQSLKILLSVGISLYVADSQAKLILSLLSLTNVSLPQESYPLFLRLLYVWVRKSSKPSLLLMDSAVGIVCDTFSTKFDFNKSPLFFAEGVLLLGALSFVPSILEKSKSRSMELISKLLEEDYRLISSSDELMPSVLAGIAYALASSGHSYFSRLLCFLFEIWDKENGPHSSVAHGLMILHLIEWVTYNLLNSHSLEKIEIFSRDILESPKPTYASFAVVMASAGVLRASSRSVSTGTMQLRISAEQRIEIVASDLITKTETFCDVSYEPRVHLLLQCITLGLARCGSVTYKNPLLQCLAFALLTEIFPLQRFYKRVLGSHVRRASLGVNEVKEHLGSVCFKEAGAITGVFCSQYASADGESKSKVENLIWDYCRDLYLWHRQVVLLLCGNMDELIGDLEKIAESAFLMVVVFASTVTKHMVDSRFSHQIQLEISVRILVSFSCLEYFRRMCLSEYMDTIRKVVVSVQEDETACVSFLESIPSYGDLTYAQDASGLQKMKSIWFKDEVQTARILFYLRVIPTCVELLPALIYRKVMAPITFLYMGHPNGKVARASHSMFVAFISSGMDSDEEERVSLKEQLVFYYMQRSLEGYPGVTPFDGMASGVAALVRYLPAGSPSIFYCIHCLVEKATSLCSEVVIQESDQWQEEQGELDPCKKLLELLLRLLSLVDIQVLPSLMKPLAHLVVQLPRELQNMVLNDLYAHIADSDNVTRKPTLVSWVQSLSYLCSQATSRKTSSSKVKVSLPVGRLILELPAGMLDDNVGDVAGAVIREVEEETGILLNLTDMVDHTAFLDPTTGRTVLPSPGGCDEELSLLLYGGEVSEEIISQLQGKETGLWEHGELIKVHVPYETLWRMTGDAKALMAFALYEVAKREGLLPRQKT